MRGGVRGEKTPKIAVFADFWRQYANEIFVQSFKVFKFKDFFKIKMKNRVVDGVVEGIRLASSIFNREVLNFGNFLKSRYFWPKANKKFDIHPAPPHPTHP